MTEPRSRHGTAARLRPFGESIFSSISRLAVQHGAVNLGQGFPNFDGPDFVKEAGIAAIRGGFGQYARSAGLPETNRAVAARVAAATGIDADPDAEVTITGGCTEAIAATMLGLVEPGDEVVLVEPSYDSYAACVAMAGGVVRPVRLHAPDFAFPLEELRRAVGPRTRMIVVNTPHNPTGRVFTEAELAGIAQVAIAADCLVLADEVYEELWYARPHRSIRALPGMRERTVLLSSLGKTFSLTGWKIGWAVAPAHLTAGIRAAHQFLTFCAVTPMQRAACEALAAPPAYFEALRADYAQRRDALLETLRAAGFDPFVPEGSYFVLADHRRFGHATDADFARHLIERVGVACIPCSAFYMPRADGTLDEEATSLVRFAFCKTHETIAQAGERLRAGQLARM
ncbi:MAG: aminotransferase class I/II-fold pyridoxal phosphate-dependent enzyme [Phycisphaerales bacterium]